MLQADFLASEMQRPLAGSLFLRHEAKDQRIELKRALDVMCGKNKMVDCSYTKHRILL